MKNQITISRHPIIKGCAEFLPASKSISNRALIIKALSSTGSDLANLSDANDTQLMLRLISSEEELINVEDAGTTMRFLTAYFAITGKKKILTGTARMQERPIGILVDALRSLGASIDYIGKEGYPPHKINGFDKQLTDHIRIKGDISSQFISAIMMIAPTLPLGLTIDLTGKIGSRPYIEMTASLMRSFGAKCSFVDNTIQIEAQPYTSHQLFVESDWSAVSYWFAFVALAEEADITLKHLFSDSLQGDQAIQEIMIDLGVSSEYASNGNLHLKKKAHKNEISWDFTHCPDLAQTVAVVCAAKGVKGKFTGLESLRIKETDRIAALQNELKKIGADLLEEDARWTLIPTPRLPAEASFNTYEDHRMAMAFAPLATLMNVVIENPDVVRKSYPKYWMDMEGLGFSIKNVAGKDSEE